MSLRTLNYGNYGIFLKMGHAGFTPSVLWVTLQGFWASCPSPESSPCRSSTCQGVQDASGLEAGRYIKPSKYLKIEKQLNSDSLGVVVVAADSSWIKVLTTSTKTFVAATTTLAARCLHPWHFEASRQNKNSKSPKPKPEKP